MREQIRQGIHLFFGCAIAAFVLYAGKDIAAPFLLLSVFGGLILSDALSRGYSVPLISSMIERLDRKDAVPGRGALLFVIAALVCVVFFPIETAFAGILVLAVLDSVSTVAGIQWGRHRIYNKKSVEGSLAGALAAAIVLVAGLGMPLIPAAAVAAGAAVVEMVSPVDDNLTVPVAACLLIVLVG